MADLKDIFGSNAIGDDRYTNSGASGLSNIISDVLPNIYIVSGLILFLYLVFGGFLLISAGSDSKKAEAGQQALTNAIIGFVIVFASFWIIQIIEIITGIPIVKGS